MEQIDKSLSNQYAWINKITSDKLWYDALDKSIKEALHIPSNEVRLLDNASGFGEIIPMLTSSMWEAAIEIHKKYPTAKIILHNFADVRHPGGWFMNRSGGAQEESLCMESGLGCCLVAKNYSYDDCYNSVVNTPHEILNMRPMPVLYNREVPTCTEIGSTENPIFCDYLTSALMNIKRTGKQEGYFTMLKERVDAVFTVVANECADTELAFFITGAWGCGVFKNDPIDVFQQYIKSMADINERVHNNNVNVVIAVPSGRNAVTARAMFNC